MRGLDLIALVKSEVVVMVDKGLSNGSVEYSSDSPDSSTLSSVLTPCKSVIVHCKHELGFFGFLVEVC